MVYGLWSARWRALGHRPQTIDHRFLQLFKIYGLWSAGWLAPGRRPWTIDYRFSEQLNKSMVYGLWSAGWLAGPGLQTKDHRLFLTAE